MAFRYPVALELDGRRCVVIGGGDVGEHKARGLLDAGARTTVIAEDATAGLRELAAAGEVELVPRRYLPGDLSGAFLAIAATDDPALNAEIHAEASERRVLMNAVDDTAHCDFAAPSVLRRGDLTISVSTGGRAPALAKRLRSILSEEVGPEWEALVDVLAAARAEALAAQGGQRDVDFGTWAARWRDALEQDLIDLIRAGRSAEVAGIVRQSLSGGSTAAQPSGPGEQAEAVSPASGVARSGSVAIVGAGPGAPDLITVRGQARLESADVIVYDRLVHPSLWEGRTAIDAGKEAGSHQVDQEQINALLVSLAREGKAVVRLKGGDPFVFGRGAEEAEVLAAAGIPFEVVPAPTSAVAALGAAGIPITDRRHGSSVAIVTGHCAAGDGVDWDRLATAVDTIVVLMGLGHLHEIVQRLAGAGLPVDTPAAIVSLGTLPEQCVVVADLGHLEDAAAQGDVCAPAIIVFGKVVSMRERLRRPARVPDHVP